VPWVRSVVAIFVVWAAAGCTGSAPVAAPAAPPGTSAAATAPGSAAATAPGSAAATAPGSAAATALSSATVTLVGAGDIARCDGDGDSRTAALLETIPGTVFTLGDNAYNRGSREEFARCYGPTWGRARPRTRPVIGNHEYGTPRASGYFDYFGAAAGPRGKGYYSYDVGAWHVVVLNTTCGAVPGGCGVGSPQERWLRADLAASRAVCTVAMTHQPPFTSGAVHGPATETRPLVRTLYRAGVDILLSGHNHHYERFALQTAEGRRDDARGIRAFVVGTGGAGRYPFARPRPNSEVRDDDAYGVLRLTLRPGSYRWQFVPVPGARFTDSGGGSCH
jgi:hypothetical protein